MQRQYQEAQISRIKGFQDSQTYVTSKETESGEGLSLTMKREKSDTSGPKTIGLERQDKLIIKKSEKKLSFRESRRNKAAQAARKEIEEEYTINKNVSGSRLNNGRRRKNGQIKTKENCEESDEKLKTIDKKTKPETIWTHSTQTCTGGVGHEIGLLRKPKGSEKKRATKPEAGSSWFGDPVKHSQKSAKVGLNKLKD